MSECGPALDVREVTKRFRKRRFRKRRSQPAPAVDRVSFSVAPAEVFGIIGANGSGKSTLVRILSTLLLPDAGQVFVFGHDVVAEPMRVRQLINRVSADPSFFRPMSAVENLRFFGRAYGLSAATADRESLQILSRLGIDAAQAKAPMLRMSRGQQQKVAVARAFLTRPRLMLLDEPTTGLDPRSKRDVQQFIAEVRREEGVTVLLTTHDMAEAELLCDRMAFLAAGRIVAEGSPLQLRKEVAGERPVDEVSMDDVFMEITGRSLDEDEEEQPDD